MNKNNPNIQALIKVCSALDNLSEQVVLVGGCATGLLITDPAAPEVRATKDVDVVVEVVTRKQYYDFASQLKAKGFIEDQTAKVLCRWKIDDMLLDVMPIEGSVLGFSNYWYKMIMKQFLVISINKKTKIKVVNAPLFLATKFEAFLERGIKDLMLSTDLEDIITVIDGRLELITEIRGEEKELKSYLAKQCQNLLNTPAFTQQINGFLPGDYASQQRVPLLLERIKAISTLV